ncbi:hypothetical protein EGW08_012889, partial [Elysia chlorotica]
MTFCVSALVTMATTQTAFYILLTCLAYFGSKSRSTAAATAIRPACSPVPPNPLFDIFHTDQGDSIWPKYKPRRIIQARQCKKGHTLVYPARKSGHLSVNCGQC